MRNLLALLALALALPANADSLTIHVIRSPLGLDYRSPAALTLSTLLNGAIGKLSGADHVIGHTFVELECSGFTDFPVLVGQTSPPEVDDADLLFNQGYGLGLMLYRVPGVFDAAKKLKGEIEAHAAKTARMADLRIKISPTTCSRLTEYYRQYSARGYDRVYAGLDADPLKGEGSGCAAFSWSFLRVGGLVLPELTRDWRRQLGVPLAWVGGPTTGRKINLKDLAVTFEPWLPFGDGTTTEQVKPIDFFDLDRSVEWITREYQAFETAGYSPAIPGMTRFKNGTTLGLEIDLSDRPTPTEPFFLVP